MSEKGPKQEDAQKLTSFRDGFQKGFIEGGYHIPSGIAGAPVDLIHFGLTRLSAHTGNWFTVDKKDTVGSSDWIHAKLMTGQRKYEDVIGIKPTIIVPESDADTGAEIGKVTAIGASFFIPNPLSKASESGRALTIVEKLRRNFGFQTNMAELSTLPVIGAEKLLGITYPAATRVTPALHAQAPAPAKPQDSSLLRTNFTGAATPSPVMQGVIGSVLRGDLSQNGTREFNPESVGALQTALRVNFDKTFGRETAAALNQVVKENLNPAVIGSDPGLKTQYFTVMRDLAKSLKDNPADPRGYDARVVAFQICGHALGHYDGAIDGLAGPKTEQAMKLMAPPPVITAAAPAPAPA